MKKSILYSGYIFSFLMCLSCGTVNDFIAEESPQKISHYSQGLDWYAGTARFSITPGEGSYIAGFRFNRKQTGVHDDLYASCVSLGTKKGFPEVVFVSVDVIGFMKNDIDEIRKAVKRVFAYGVIVSATHTHSGPDTIGFWGQLPILTSGRDKNYIAFLKTQILKCIEGAAGNMMSVFLTTATTTGEGLAEFDNREDADVLDLTLGVLQGTDQRTGAILFTLANFAAHPNLMQSTEISADFPYGFYKEMEEKHAGMGIFINGAAGNVGPGNSFKRRDWAEMERLGRVFGSRALDALNKSGTKLINVYMFYLNNEFLLLIDNLYYEIHFLTGTIPRPLDREWRIKTEVDIIRIGELTIVTVPGEIFPSIAKEIRLLFSQSTPLFIFGLTNDELGYAMTKEEYDSLPRGNFHRLTSPGKHFGNAILQQLKSMMPIFFEHLKRCYCTAFLSF